MGPTPPGLNIDGFNILPAGYRWGMGRLKVLVGTPFLERAGSAGGGNKQR